MAGLMKVASTLAGALAVAGALGCSEGDARRAGAPEEDRSAEHASASTQRDDPSPQDLIAQGRQSYLSNCIACHNPDPKIDGSLGPAIAGSPKALTEDRVLRGEYPEGYTPKRQSQSMIPMPFLEKQIPALAAYLESEG